MKQIGASIVCFLLLAAVLFFALPVQARLIDKIVATVDSEVITLSDLIRLKLLIERTDYTLLERDKVLVEGSLNGVLNELVMLTLVYRQAVKLNLTDFDEEALKARFSDFKNTFENAAALEDFIYSNGWRTEQDVYEIFRRYAIAEMFATKRVNLQVELRMHSYYEEYVESKYGGRSFEEVEDRVKQDLYNEELADWMNDLRRNAKVKIIGSEL